MQKEIFFSYVLLRTYNNSVFSFKLDVLDPFEYIYIELWRNLKLIISSQF